MGGSKGVGWAGERGREEGPKGGWKEAGRGTKESAEGAVLEGCGQV